jgi:hypothetical protein
LNGQSLEEDRLVNRPLTAVMAMGGGQSVIAVDGSLTLPWAPDFVSADSNKYYALAGQKASEFEFVLSGLLKEGINTLVFKNLAGMEPPPKLVVGDLSLRARPLGPGTKALGSAPSGPLPICEPETVFPKTFDDLRQEDSTLRFVVSGKPMIVESAFSTPDGQWRRGDNPYFTVRRRVVAKDQWILVSDTLRNLTRENLPLMQRHACKMPQAARGTWLGGLPSGRTAHSSVPDNPSAFAALEDCGVGLVALNDEFRVHVQQAASDREVEIADRTYVLKSGGEYTAEWAVVPVATPNFWRFVNAARRMMDVNFELKYCFALQGPMGRVLGRHRPRDVQARATERLRDALEPSVPGMARQGYPAPGRPAGRQRHALDAHADAIQVHGLHRNRLDHALRLDAPLFAGGLGR